METKKQLIYSLKQAQEAVDVKRSVFRKYESMLPPNSLLKNPFTPRRYSLDDVNFLKGLKILHLQKGGSLKYLKRQMEEKGSEFIINAGRLESSYGSDEEPSLEDILTSIQEIIADDELQTDEKPVEAQPAKADQKARNDEGLREVSNKEGPLDRFPNQEIGFNFGIADGMVVYKPSTVDPNSITARLHVSLLNATSELQNSHQTIGNKYKSLLNAISAYHKSINHDVSAVDAVDVYACGLDLDTEYKEALAYAGDELGEYPHLSHDEKSAIQKVIRRHAAYIQSTPEGAYFTDAEERHLRSFEEERQRTKDVKNAAEALLARADIADPIGVQKIYDYADPSANDPNASRKKALSRIGLRNFLIVAGIGTAISTGGGVAIGVAVGTVAGPAIGGAAGTFSLAGIGWISKRTIQETKAFKEFTIHSASQIDEWLEKERPKLKPLSEFFINSWEVFRPTLDNSGISEWFEQIHSEASLTKTPKAIRILLAEDNVINALLTRTLLEAEGHFVDVVEDGLLATEAMQASSYDMVFMDLGMPKMDGFEASKKIRSMPEFPIEFPIIALTNNAITIEDKKTILESGMNDFLAKPVSADELSHIIRKYTKYP